MYLETLPSREWKIHLQHRSWRWPVLPLGALGTVGPWPRLWWRRDLIASFHWEWGQQQQGLNSFQERTGTVVIVKLVCSPVPDRVMDSPRLGMSAQQYSLWCCCWNWGLAPHHVASRPVSPTLFDSVSYPNKSCFSKYLFCFSWL